MMSNIQRNDIKITIAPLPPYRPDDINIYTKPLYASLSLKGFDILEKSPDYFSFKWLFKNIRRIDILHIHWPSKYYTSDASIKILIKLLIFTIKLLTCRFSGIKIVWTVHNLYPHYYYPVRYPQIYHYIHKLARRLIATLSNLIIAHCHVAERLIRQHFGCKPEKIIVLPHGSLCGWFPIKGVSKTEARKKLNFPLQAFIYLCFGRIEPYKGIKNLLEVCKKHLGDEDIVIVAGKPTDLSLKRRLEAERPSKVIFEMRYIPDAEIEYYFATSDMVVLPYENILTSGAAVTALSFGKPVIAPEMGCLPEILDKDFSILYNHKDSKGLSNALNKAKELDRSLAKKQAQKRAEELRWEGISIKTAKAFEKLISG
ncbi:MAG: glycosyltransferase [Deltaproteobacteria bacterium]|nr:glycosyltransferase [Deltaproteobacteria bacterium]